MLEVIIGLALLPFALVGLLMVLGVIVFTWRYLLAGILLIIVSLVVISNNSLEAYLKIIIIYIAGLLLFAFAKQLGEDHGPLVNNKLDDSLNDDEEIVLEYMRSKKRFKLSDIKKEFDIKSNVQARAVVDSMVKKGYVKIEGAGSLHWIVTDKS